MAISKGNARRSRPGGRATSRGPEPGASYGRRESDYDNRSHQQYGQQYDQQYDQPSDRQYGRFDQQYGQPTGRGQQRNYFEGSSNQQNRFGDRSERFGDYDQSGYGAGNRSNAGFDYDYDEDRSMAFRGRDEDEDSGQFEDRDYSWQGNRGNDWDVDSSERWQRGVQQGQQQNRSSRSQSTRNRTAQGRSQTGRSSQRSQNR